MTSCDSSLILELLEKTEANLKRVEIIWTIIGIGVSIVLALIFH